ncbi:hypothetical protein HNP81_002789 [Peribacillus huizhouensis]|uniref:Uncharacterized protein n=1 Tax=Peribacillus huizhouensis TaxID=1501239 RepID=A0ABR6CR40_9BACI|nr:hypothetical protein [Peribacillus huizhouensis]
MVENKPKTPKDIRRRPVAFNYNDPHQRKIYEYSLQFTNFSAYIKMLIQRDMDTDALD